MQEASKRGGKGDAMRICFFSLCRSLCNVVTAFYIMLTSYVSYGPVCTRKCDNSPPTASLYAVSALFVGSGAAGHAKQWSSDVPAAVKHGSNTKTHHAVSQRSREITLEEHRIPHLLNQYVGTCTPLA